MTPRPDGVRAIRGLVTGLALSAPLWALIFWSLT